MDLIMALFLSCSLPDVRRISSSSIMLSTDATDCGQYESLAGVELVSPSIDGQLNRFPLSQLSNESILKQSTMPNFTVLKYASRRNNMLFPCSTMASGDTNPAWLTTPGGENSGRKKENTDGYSKEP